MASVALVLTSGPSIHGVGVDSGPLVVAFAGIVAVAMVGVVVAWIGRRHSQPSTDEAEQLAIGTFVEAAAAGDFEQAEAAAGSLFRHRGLRLEQTG